MRSVLALSFVVGAIATASALPISRSDLAVDTHTARQFPPPIRPEDKSQGITREQEKAQRERTDALRPDNPSGLMSASGQGENGGIVSTPPAVGADADDGGSSYSSPNAASESGSSLDVLQNTVQPGGPLQSADSQEDKFYNPGGAYGYARRVPRATSSPKLLRMRQVNINIPVIKDGGSSDSGQDGSDGTATQGTAKPGGGPNGGTAQAGHTGSVDGGRVHNNPEGAFKAPSVH